jgi:DNA-binding transcriptional regulator GbsR (MarR family)
MTGPTLSDLGAVGNPVLYDFTGRVLAGPFPRNHFVHFFMNKMIARRNGLWFAGRTMSRISQFEQEVIELFVRVADVLSLPRSVGEIYGLLYISSEPLCMDDLRTRLNISKGSVSQGLRFLRSFGAVRTVYVAGSRKDYFEAEIELRKMVAGFVKEQVQPHLVNGKERLKRLNRLLEEEPEERAEPLREKLEQLSKWRAKAATVLPVAMKLVDHG